MANSEPLDLSLGEFRSLVAKAFRGAGYGWGLVEDAAFAGGRLAEFGFDAGGIVVELLGVVDGVNPKRLMPLTPRTGATVEAATNKVWESEDGVLCPVAVGTTLVDLGYCRPGTFEGLVQPVLLAPFLQALLTEPGGPGGFVLDWEHGRCEVTSGRISLVGAANTNGHAVAVSSSNVDNTSATQPVRRICVDAATIAQLHGFAHRTYAPATESSRQNGAGAEEPNGD